MHCYWYFTPRYSPALWDANCQHWTGTSVLKIVSKTVVSMAMCNGGRLGPGIRSSLPVCVDKHTGMKGNMNKVHGAEINEVWTTSNLFEDQPWWLQPWLHEEVTAHYKVPSIMQRKLSHTRALPEHEITDTDVDGLNQSMHTGFTLTHLQTHPL